MTLVLNFVVKKNPDGGKHLDVQCHGVIDGEWGDAADGTDSAKFVAALKEHSNADTVDVRINSVGGSLFGGVAMNTALASHPGQTRSIVEGLAASAASLVALGAKKVVMGRGAMMMIHKPASVTMGNADEHRKSADMLDKAQEAITAIYTAKTGMSAEDVKALVDDETWMTAEDCLRDGFADSIGEDESDAGEPDPNGAHAPEDRGAAVVWNGVSFPKASLPAQIVAMAKAPAAVSHEYTDAFTDDKGNAHLPTCGKCNKGAFDPIHNVSPKPLRVAAAPTVPVIPIVNRALLAEKAPELLAALVEEGRLAERARLKAIDDLDIPECAALVAAAKYGATPCDAPTLAMAALKARKGAGQELLAARLAESGPLATVTPTAPDQTESAAQARVVQAMIAGGNSRRGGKT